MKTSHIKFSFLVLLTLLVACGKPTKETDPDNSVQKQNSTVTEGPEQAEAKLKQTIVTNDVDELQKIVTTTNIDLKDTKIGSDTPLIMAINNGSEAVIDRLINVDMVDINQTNDIGVTPLMAAVLKRNEALVMKLIMAKAKLDEKNAEGDTALHIAIRSGQEKIAIELVNHGANIRISDKDSLTTDQLAEEMKLNELHRKIVKMLQIDISAPDLHTFRSTLVDGDLKTLGLMLADFEGIAQTYESINPIALILELEPNKDNDAQQMIYLLLTGRKPISVDGPKTADYSPLIKAAMLKKTNYVDLLLEYKANPNMVDKAGRSALIHAIGNNNPQMVGSLLDHKASKKYTVVRGTDKKKVTFEGCDVARAVGKKVKDTEGKKNIKKIKEKLDCGFLEWLF